MGTLGGRALLHPLLCILAAVMTFVAGSCSQPGQTRKAPDNRAPSIVWKVPIGQPSGSAVTVRNTVFISSMANSEPNPVPQQNFGLAAISATDGRIEWNRDYKDANSSRPAVHGPNVVIAMTLRDGPWGDKTLKNNVRVVAHDLKTGQLRWTFNTSGDAFSDPVIIGDKLYLASRITKWRMLDHEHAERENHTSFVHVLDTTGRQVAKHRLHEQEVMSLSANGGRLILTTNRIKHDRLRAVFVFAIEPATGKSLWQRTYLRESSMTKPAFAADAIYVMSLWTGEPPHYSRLSAINPADGSTLWEKKLPGLVEGSLPELAYADGTLVVSSFRKLFAVDARKKSVKWRIERHGDSFGTPLIVDGKLVIGTSPTWVPRMPLERSGNLYAADLATGKELWGVKTPGHVDVAAIPLAGRLIVPTNMDGFLLSVTEGSLKASSPAQ